MLRLALLLSLVALLAATAASAATPAQYRAKLNGICRGYTPKLKTLEKVLDGQPTAAQLRTAVKSLLSMGVAQDRQLEAEPVPTSLRATMRPIIARLKKIDAEALAGIHAVNARNQAALLTHLGAISRLATPLDRWLDAAGLRDCGSNQT